MIRESRLDQNAFIEEALHAICLRLEVKRKHLHFGRYGLAVLHTEKFDQHVNGLPPETRAAIIEMVIKRLQELVEEYGKVQPALIEVVLHKWAMEASLYVNLVPVPFLAWKPSQSTS